VRVSTGPLLGSNRRLLLFGRVRAGLSETGHVTFRGARHTSKLPTTAAALHDALRSSATPNGVVSCRPTIRVAGRFSTAIFLQLAERLGKEKCVPYQVITYHSYSALVYVAPNLPGAGQLFGKSKHALTHVLIQKATC